MQKSKLNWFRLGVENNSYFHAIVRGKNKNKNGIQHLIGCNGEKLTDPKDIENEVLTFYNNLVGTASQQRQHVDIVALKNGAQKDDTDRQFSFNMSLTKRFLMP